MRTNIYSFAVDGQPVTFERTWLSESVYEQVTRALPIVCADVILYDQATQSIILAERQVRPQKGLWMIGGRLFAGETTVAAGLRHLKVDLGLEIAENRLKLITVNEYFFPDRHQNPQDVACHSVVFVFALAVEAHEMSSAMEYIGAPEYRKGSMRRYVPSELHEQEASVVLHDLYKKLFPNKSIQV